MIFYVISHIHNEHCEEHYLRDALESVYPKHHHHEKKVNERHDNYINTRWHFRKHESIYLSDKEVEDLYSHPCVHKIVPLYYENGRNEDNRHMHSKNRTNTKRKKKNLCKQPSFLLYYRHGGFESEEHYNDWKEQAQDYWKYGM